MDTAAWKSAEDFGWSIREILQKNEDMGPTRNGKRIVSSEKMKCQDLVRGYGMIVPQNFWLYLRQVSFMFPDFPQKCFRCVAKSGIPFEQTFPTTVLEGKLVVWRSHNASRYILIEVTFHSTSQCSNYSKTFKNYRFDLWLLTYYVDGA